MLKRKIKRVFEHVAAKFGRHERRSSDPELLILGYHRIIPLNHPEFQSMEPGMRVQPATLEMHIKILRQHFDFVDLNDWVSRVTNRLPVPNKAVALTFDDGWVDNYEYAYPVLKREKVPATIFLVSSMIGTDSQFWPERISGILSYIKGEKRAGLGKEALKWFEQYQFDVNNSRSFDEAGVNALILRLKEKSDDEIYKSLTVFADVECKIPHLAHIMNKAQLLEMKASGFISFGAHTKRHFRLDKISDYALLEDEILGSKSDLEGLLDITVSGFCYPNGSFDNKAAGVVKRGFQYSCTTRKGWNSTKSDLLLLNRILLHDDVSHDPVSFKARISGLI